MEIWRSLAGMVRLELTCAEPERVMQRLNRRGIELYAIEQVSLVTCRFLIRRKDYKTAAGISEASGGKLKLLGRKGSYWTLKALGKRPVLMFGLAVFLALCLYLPTRVLFVQVEGNESIPRRKILAAAEECGIRFGASRRQVRSEQVKNALLSAVPQLQWAGVNTSGCVATISVRERTEEEKNEEEAPLTSIVAARDGFLLSATATKGNLLVQPGQTVKAGQTLISAYTDCGICIRVTGAEGEVFAQTRRFFTAVTPLSWQQRRQIRTAEKKYSLLLGKKRVNLWKDSGISDATCGRMYEEYYVTLPGGFQLPLALCVDQYIFWDADSVETETAEAALKDYAAAYLKRQMAAGEIHLKSETITTTDGVHRLEGSYVCREMIGRPRQEQIGEINGKID